MFKFDQKKKVNFVICFRCERLSFTTSKWPSCVWNQLFSATTVQHWWTHWIPFDLRFVTFPLNTICILKLMSLDIKDFCKYRKWKRLSLGIFDLMTRPLAFSIIFNVVCVLLIWLEKSEKRSHESPSVEKLTITN